MKTSEVLRKAGDVLRERGWHQGQFESPCGAVCVFGAVNVAITSDPGDGSLSREPVDMIRRILKRWPPNWNDAPGRTAAEVLATLDAAYVVALQEEGDDPADYEVL